MLLIRFSILSLVRAPNEVHNVKFVAVRPTSWQVIASLNVLSMSPYDFDH